MTARHLANVAFRILGLMWSAAALVSLPEILTLGTAADANTRRIILTNTLVQILWLIIGVLLFVYCDRIAARMFRGDEPLEISATAPQLQEIGFSLLALYLGIPALVRVIALIYEAKRRTMEGESQLKYAWQSGPERIVSTFISLVLCIALFFGSRALTAFWQKLRAREVSEPES
jgi:hypothetical protein